MNVNICLQAYLVLHIDKRNLVERLKSFSLWRYWRNEVISAHHLFSEQPKLFTAVQIN